MPHKMYPGISAAGMSFCLFGNLRLYENIRHATALQYTHVFRMIYRFTKLLQNYFAMGPGQPNRDLHLFC